ncbi:MAG: hypothetical protein LUQ17_03930, partial [Methanomicrobiales archaeon]|nr:hypothetical protein [Methanomicrobiales archaeon]
MVTMKTLPKKDEKNWSKIGIIVLGIGFALLFVGTYVLTILTGTVFAPNVKEGDTVAIDLTIRDTSGNPIITTDQQLYSTTLRSGNPVFFTPSFSLVVNGSYNQSIIGIDAYNPTVSVGPVTYGMLGLELEMISSGLTGMHKGETKTISLSSIYSTSSTLSKEDYEQLGGNFSRAAVGDMYPWSFADQPTIDLNQTGST